jgi:hypothetical protein
MAGLDQAEAYETVQPKLQKAQGPAAPTTAPAQVTAASTEFAAGQWCRLC